MGTRQFSANKVVKVIEEVAIERGKPNSIRVDNGPEFTGRIDFSSPGKLTDNTFISSFNSRALQECLNVHYFLSLMDIQEKVEQWHNYYNNFIRLVPWETLPRGICRHQSQRTSNQIPSKTRLLTGTVLGTPLIPFKTRFLTNTALGTPPKSKILKIGAYIKKGTKY